MTTQPLTPEQINVMVAESLGHRWHRLDCSFGGRHYRALFASSELPIADMTEKLCNDAFMKMHLPNFHGSLDACATFEAGLTDTLKVAYASVLFDVCGSWASAVLATSQQKCTAYLRVKLLSK